MILFMLLVPKYAYVAAASKEAIDFFFFNKALYCFTCHNEVLLGGLKSICKKNIYGTGRRGSVG